MSDLFRSKTTPDGRKYVEFTVTDRVMRNHSAASYIWNQARRDAEGQLFKDAGGPVPFIWTKGRDESFPATTFKVGEP